MNTINIQGIIDKAKYSVDRHRLSVGAYARYLWQNADQSWKMGLNEYGCADAANILYTIGAFPKDASERSEWIRVMQELQDPITGMFSEATHHPIHTTAHCTAALELFDAVPQYPLTMLEKYLDCEKMHDLLANLKWEDSPWDNSHQGAGLFAALCNTGMATLAWKKDYFEWLRSRADAECGIGLEGRKGSAPMAHQLYGWFHYLFNHEYAHMPIPYPDKLIDTCIDMYKKDQFGPAFCREVGFMEIDWIFAVNRATRHTAHRFNEVKTLLEDCAERFLPWLDSLDVETNEGLNDLHMLFGAMCAVAELQIALPGKIESEIPLKIVLDRRPFI